MTILAMLGMMLGDPSLIWVLMHHGQSSMGEEMSYFPIVIVDPVIKLAFMDSPYWSSDLELSERLKLAPQKTITEEEPYIGLLLDRALPEWLASKSFDLSWSQDANESPKDWQRRAHEYFCATLRWNDAQNREFDPVVRNVSEKDGYRRTELELTLTYPLRAPATILEPLDEVKSGRPGVLLLHCMGGYRLYGREKLLPCDGESESLKEYQRNCYSGRNIAEALVKRGYVVMAIDAFNFGERTFNAAKNPEAFREWRKGVKDIAESWPYTKVIGGTEESDLIRCIESSGKSWISLILNDDIRSLDFLSQWPSVDPARIGCGGLSYGGYRTNLLTAFDQRVRAAVSVCWTSSINEAVLHNPNGTGWFMHMRDLFTRMDLPDIQSLIAPRAFMSVSGWEDTLFTPYSTAVAHDKLRRFFTAYGCPEQLGSLILPTVHEFNLSMQDSAFDFFDEKLKAPASV
ncbi:MAG: alpha/beta hydrolase family protein [Chthoniobacterales bacterium]